MTPGQRDPRPSGFGPLSWLWWPLVLGVLWPLAGLSLLVWPPGCPVLPRGGGNGRRNGPGGYPRPSGVDPRQNWLRLAPRYGVSELCRARIASISRLALAALLALAACAPASDPDPRCRWPGFRCAIGGPPRTLAANPPVVVDNPFRCPRRASP